MPKKSLIASVADDEAAPGGVAAVDRALSLLSAFKAGEGGLSLAELATRTRMYKSTVLRLLASLEHAQFVQRFEDGRYGLGGKVAALNAVYAASFSLERIVLPVLRQLVQRTGESAAYHVLQGRGASAVRLCLYRVDSPHPVRDHTKAGDVLPANRGTGARVLAAYDSDRAPRQSEDDRRLSQAIRERGYHAAADDRLEGVSGISAPVFRADGSIAGALTLTMPTHRYDENLAPAVIEAARELSGQVT